MEVYALAVGFKNESDLSKVSLINCKNRVVPVKSISLHKLKICEAFTSAELIYAIIESLNVNEKHFLTDCTITLSWILKPPTKEINLFSIGWSKYVL